MTLTLALKDLLKDVFKTLFTLYHSGPGRHLVCVKIRSAGTSSACSGSKIKVCRRKFITFSGLSFRLQPLSMQNKNKVFIHQGQAQKQPQNWLPVCKFTYFLMIFGLHSFNLILSVLFTSLPFLFFFFSLLSCHQYFASMMWLICRSQHANCNLT